MSDEIWDTNAELGRRACRDGVGRDECELIGRARLAWFHGYGEEFGQSTDAADNEAKTKKAAKKLAKAAKG